MPTFGDIFEAIFDFVTKGGLKKTVIGLMVLSLVAVSGAYLVYPQTTTSVALSAVGATPEGQFEPPAIEGNDTVGYVGQFSGGGGPTNVPVEGEIRAEINFGTGRVVATAQGDSVSEGYLEGEVGTRTGETNGTGAVNAFGLTGIEFNFEGEYSQDGSVAEGTWKTVSGSEMSGDGTWRIERVEDGTVDISENSD
ncbi:MAG: hypothetical protein ACI9QA_000311 [Methanobacteriota archaeon]|jgi:hypothetical protein